jgi:aminoglycoside phosphotransferase (APT) family kinase protein
VSDTTTSANGWRWLEPILGEPVATASPVTQPWSTPTETTVLTLGTGIRVVVQTGSDASAIAKRATLGRLLHEVAPWLPLPRVIATDAAVSPAWLVTSFIDGESGRSMLSSHATASALGELAGRLVAALARVPTARIPLPGLWGSRTMLATSARVWHDDLTGHLEPLVSQRLGRLIGGAPATLDDALPVFAHGDLAPVNLIVRGGELVGLLDLEHARLADRLFDLAWFRWTLRWHHPDVWVAASRSALVASGVADEAMTHRRLDLLAALQCLERLAATPSSAAARDQLAAAVNAASRDTVSQGR